MSEVENLFNALSSDQTKKHKDLKFFLGENPGTVDAIARECRLAIEADQQAAQDVFVFHDNSPIVKECQG
jgi:hypothetical protein